MIIKWYPNRMENWTYHISFMKKDKSNFSEQNKKIIEQYNMIFHRIEISYGILMLTLQREKNEIYVSTEDKTFPMCVIKYSPNLDINIFI